MTAPVPPPQSAANLPPELAPIALICGGPVQYIEEAGRRYIHMVGLRFLVRGTERTMDALLCPNYPNDGYPTKLYLPANLGLGLNWNENAFILGRSWFTWSWKNVPRSQSPISILAGHLEAFR